MRVLVTGAGGMIGRRVVERLLAEGRAGRIWAHDVAAPDFGDARVEGLGGDLAAEGEAGRLAGLRPDLVVHLAGVVSGQAEAEFDLGYRVNLDGTRALLEGLRAEGAHPRFVFASSIAVYGRPFPDPIPDDFAPQPLTSYGAQKLMGEILVNDFSRKGFVDGVSIRFPTVCVRPGKPNAAASGFFSGIIREPLAGQRAVLPVGRDVLHTHVSPRSAVGFVMRAATMDTAPLGGRRAVLPPGVAATVGEQIEALRRAGGDRAVALIDERPDPVIAGIVAGWPTRFEARRGRDLGFEAERSFDEIVAIHVADELGGVVP